MRLNLPTGRSAAVSAVVLVCIGSLAVQLSAVLAYGLFDSMGAASTSSIRLLIAAAILLVVFRPGLRGRTGTEWLQIVLYGVAMAAIVMLLYFAIERIPLGVAMTINFLGACAVALFTSRRLREVLLAFAALAGVGLIAGLGGPLDPLGLLFAVGSAASLALYTLLAARVGQSNGGIRGVALSLTVAAILTLPISAPVIPEVGLHQWGLLLLSAALAPALAFTVDTVAGKLTSARVIGVLFAFDPVMGTLVGALLLGQLLTLPTLAGIALVVAAGVGIVWFAGEGGERLSTADDTGPIPHA